MRRITYPHVRKWTKVQNISTPHSFSTWCPHCNEKVTFTCTNHQHDQHRAAVSSSANCPGCSHHVGVWSLGANGPESAEVYIHPNSGEPHAPKDVASSISEPLYRSYTSTIDAYNSGNYVATAVCCRRTLEGLFQGLLPECNSVSNLFRAITEVAESVDLAEPIRNLANVLRQGGNLGAHFDMEKEPDEEMALQMLTLLENLIDFLHVLPQEISNLEQLLDSEA
ncbi:DUF4145 domain-containing protein [Cycloclasticus sp.]|uniref:DUF4145 domain-containing protein n=1 Tax=Cycloclasticus sp. TaxID=2024830 RepID=UPI000C0DD1E9|nr:DUF4145 domain-containing protein [Cycloclasticus sp.]PHR52138.1 MAG: hypothetical protein COA48_03450 [Cycloclasticus sp.]